ncbi:MAG TPA: c-type cytochrome [Marinagarivorans sp.]
MKLTVLSRGVLAALAVCASIGVFANSDLEERLKPVGDLCMAGDECAAAVVEVAAGPRDGKQVYDTNCTLCHAAGLAGAPKPGDAAEWGARIDARGMDGLFDNAWNGYNAMPAKGTCIDCSEDEIKAAIAYMLEG